MKLTGLGGGGRREHFAGHQNEADGVGGRGKERAFCGTSK